MSDENRSYEEGRSGNFQSGGNSIDYAAYQAGRDAAFRAEQANTIRGGSRGGGGGGVARPMNFAGKLMQFGMIFGLIGIPVGAFILPTMAGAALGFGGGVGVGVLVRLGAMALAWPFRHVVKLLPFLPAVLLGGVAGTALGGLPVGLTLAGLLVVYGLVRR